MNKDAQFDRIEAYLFGQINREAATAFEEELAKDPELAKAVKLHLLEIRTMELLSKESIASNFGAWKSEKAMAESKGGAEMKVVKSKNYTQYIMRIAVAASVLLAIGFFTQQLMQKNRDSQFASNYFDENATSTKVRGINDIPEAYKQILGLMEQQRYNEALQALNISNDSVNAVKNLLLKGECYFRLNNFEKASEQYALVITNGSPAEREDGQYFLLLSLIKQGGQNKRINELVQSILKDPEHGYYLQVKEIETKL